jgi:hypothetical protein
MVEGHKVCQTLEGDRAKYPAQGRGVWRTYQAFLANRATCMWRNKSKHPPRRHSASLPASQPASQPAYWGIRCMSVTLHERGQHPATSGTGTSRLSAVWKFSHTLTTSYSQRNASGQHHQVHALQHGNNTATSARTRVLTHVAHSRKIQLDCNHPAAKHCT